METLIANYQIAEQTVNDLAILWDNPVCGVPGFGFKAARKVQPQMRQAQQEVTNATTALQQWVRGDTKMNYKRRQARLQAIQAIIPTFTLD